MRTMINKLAILVMALSVNVMLLTSFSAAATLTVKEKDGVGSYLVDDKGMALYLFKKDMPDKSVCGAANGCIDKWPVFLAESVDPKSGLDTAYVGVITRDEGIRQSTYKGQPLYYFFKDKDGGDIYGQGLNSVWYVVVP